MQSLIDDIEEGKVDGQTRKVTNNTVEWFLIAGGTILLLQKWSHDATAWESLTVARQEQVMGRTKDESVELDDKPDESHVARTDQDTFGKIFRRNMPYGTVTCHGTMFVGFCNDRRPLTTMLESIQLQTEGNAVQIQMLVPPDAISMVPLYFMLRAR